MNNFLHLVFSPPDNSVLYAGNYDAFLVGLSIVIAIFASYAALLVAQIVASNPSVSRRRWWLVGGCLCLGSGIWAMHFIGMLAFSLPCSTGYDPLITVASMLPSFLASLLVLNLISQPTISTRKLLLGGLLLGAGIGAMHYSGMAAMRLNGLIRYDIFLFLLSIVVAIALAILALWIKFRLQSSSSWRRWATAISALIMGGAVSGMHYTAMASAYFVHGDALLAPSGIAPSLLAAIVLTSTGFMAVVTIVATFLGKSSVVAVARPYKLIALLIVAWAILSWAIADNHYRRLAYTEYQRTLELATQSAAQAAKNVEDNIAQLKGVARILAQDAMARSELRRFGTAAQPTRLALEQQRQRWTQTASLAAMNHYFAVVAESLGADNIYMLNAAGDCVAASNAAETDSFVGANFADREYFRQARASQTGHQYAVGRVTGILGLYYAHAVWDAGHFVGTVVVKRGVKKFSRWISQSNALLIDANGVVLLAADSALEFHVLPFVEGANLSNKIMRLQYNKSSIPTLEIFEWQSARYPFSYLMGEQKAPVLLAAQAMHEEGLSIYAVQSLSEVARLEGEKGLLFFLVFISGSMLIIAVSAVVLFVRESRKTALDSRIAATAFETQEGMLITDSQGDILRVNQAFTYITGYTSAEVLGKNPRILNSGRQDEQFYTDMWASISQHGVWRGEIWNRRKNGELYPEYLTITSVKDLNGVVTNYVASLLDITLRKAADDEIKLLAFYDALTGLPNRRSFMDRLHQVLTSMARHDRGSALLFIDLDNFKALNDTQGHAVGDLLLQQVAKRLSACLRECDTVARLGGDEFVIMLEDLSYDLLHAAEQTEIVGEKILAALNQPYQFAANEYLNTPSIGATLFNDPAQAADELMKQADIAMYQAKKAGRNILRFFDPAMQETISARSLLEAELRSALMRNEIVLHYQIQVDHLNRPLGAEVLIRWQHPVRGMVSPAQFIPLAEETGLIISIGNWVLETACAQIKRWQKNTATRDLVLAVNVSANQFRQADFVAQVQAAIQRNGFNPNLLKLELTESMLVDEVEQTIATMNTLKTLGVQFSLDDFGTGYSSLQYLKQLPLDQLKIDQSFVRDIVTDHSDKAIVRTIIAMAESLHLDIIAEGVETEEQRHLLMEKGCLHFQGYLFSKPVPIEQFEALLR